MMVYNQNYKRCHHVTILDLTHQVEITMSRHHHVTILDLTHQDEITMSRHHQKTKLDVTHQDKKFHKELFHS